MLSKIELGGGDDGLKPSPAFSIKREFRTFTKILDKLNPPNPPILILPIKVGTLFAKHMQHEAIKRNLNVLHIKEDDAEIMIVYQKDMFRVTLEYIYGRSDVQSIKQDESDEKEGKLKELDKKEYEPGEGKSYLEEKAKDEGNDIKDDAQPMNKEKQDIESDSEEELKDEGNDIKEFNAQIPKENVFDKVPHENRTLGVRYGQADDFFHADDVTQSLLINLPIESFVSVTFKSVNKGSDTINNTDDISVVFEMVYTDTYGKIISQTIYLDSLSEFLVSHEVMCLSGRVLIRPVRKASTSQASASEATTGEASTNHDAASESKIPSNEYKSEAATRKASTSEASTNQEAASKIPSKKYESEASTSEASASKTSANQEATSVSKTPSKKYKSNISSKKYKIRPLRRGRNKFTQTGAQDDATSQDATQDSNNTHDVTDIREKMGHIIELYGFPREKFTTNNFLNIYKKEPRYVKWCDGNSVLLITGSVEQANEFLHIRHKLVKSRPITLASAVALKMAEKLPPAGNVKSMTWSRSQQIAEQSSEEEE